MSMEGLCAVDYVVMVLLEKFKGKTEIERLESYINRHAPGDIKAIVQCTGGLRSFLESQSDSFFSDSLHVACKEGRKPSKESDVIKWFRGRLKTSPRKIFSLQALQKIEENGPPGISSYFSLACPNSEKLREWFLQRTQIFKETPVGNISLQDCQVTFIDDNGYWSCIAFFVKILDEQGCDTLSVDWACLYNYIFVAENPVIMSRITSLYEEATFENFFKTNAIQFGLEIQDEQLQRSVDPANSGLEIVASSSSEQENLQVEDPLSLCVEILKGILNEKVSIPSDELEKIFCEKSPKYLWEFLQKKFANDALETFLASYENVFDFSTETRLVSLKDEHASSDTSSENIETVERVSKYDQVLLDVFRDLLVMAGEEQGVHHVDIRKLQNCVQILPKHVSSYFSQTYGSSPMQFFKLYETFRAKKNQKMIGLQEKVVPKHSDREAVATHLLNFFVQAFAILRTHGVKFIPPSQLDLLVCLLNSNSRTYIDSNFGSKKAPLKNLLMRFPEFFSESRAGNISLRTLEVEKCPFNSSDEILTNIKAICTYPNEATAIEFYLRLILEVSSQCYPVPMWWLQAKIQNAPANVIGFLEETCPSENLSQFFAKFPAIFCHKLEISSVYLEEGPLTQAHKLPKATSDELPCQDAEVILGLLAGLCSATCAPISTSKVFEFADKHFITSEVESIISNYGGETSSEKLLSLLQEFDSVISTENGNVILRWPCRLSFQLQSAFEQTLCLIIRNTVVYFAVETGLFPAIGKVFDHLQSSLNNCFVSFVSTMTDFLEFLDKFKNIFMVNGSTNTIIVKDFSVQTSYSNIEVVEPVNDAISVGTSSTSVNVVTSLKTAFPDLNRIRSWIEQRKKVMETWTQLAPLVNTFVRQMDLDTVTNFSAVHGLGDGLSNVLREIVRLMKVNATDPVLQMMGLYWEKNTVFFCELIPTTTKVANFIVKDRNCFSATCGCQKPIQFHRFEEFVNFCSSIRFHLEQGPYPGVLTPSSSGSTSSTPELLDRFSQWSETENSPLNLVLEDKSLEEVKERLLQLPADFSLWGLDLSKYPETSCWPRNIWEPKSGELGSSGQDVAERTFRVLNISPKTVTAEDVSDVSKKLKVDWPKGPVKVGDELTVTVRSKR